MIRTAVLLLALGLTFFEPVHEPPLTGTILDVGGHPTVAGRLKVGETVTLKWTGQSWELVGVTREGDK